MNPKKRCPFCGKLTDKDSRFCVHCGKKFLEGVYCLNCGRPVEENQEKCECGYELAEIKCPKCGRENPYANRFCMSCGERMWTPKMVNFQYDESFFKNNFKDVEFPKELLNLTVRKRKDAISDDEKSYNPDYDEDYLCEIWSRWAIVTPDRCVNCLIKTDIKCPCKYLYLRDRKRIDERIEELKKDSYIEPQFDNKDLKTTSRDKHSQYLSSLAPAVGESQLDYRERLKWDFKQTVHHKEKVRSERYAAEIKAKYSSRPSPEDYESGDWYAEGLPEDVWESQIRERMRENRK